jgi:chemotaxis protein methyltransferase CheR
LSRLAFLKKTLYLDPEFIMAHFAAATLYQKLGQPAEAARSRVNTLRLAQKLAPDMLIPGSDNLSAAELVKMAGAA